MRRHNTVMSAMDRCRLERLIDDLAIRFEKTCRQIVLLNHQMAELQVRYDRAAREGNTTYRYQLRLRLCVVEGTRDMYFEYAQRVGDQLDEFRLTLWGPDVFAEASVDDDDQTDDQTDNWL